MPSPPRKQRLFVVSHACVTPVNQLLFCALGQQHPELAITILAPSNWRNEYTGNSWKVEPHPDFQGDLVTLPVFFPGHISLHGYRHGIRKLLESLQPDWIYVDEEPWSLVTQQIARINKASINVPFLFHTNQNLFKRYPFPFSYFERWVFGHASHALPVGEEAAGILRQKGYQGPLTIFPYGIDETMYCPSKAAAQFRREHHATNEHVVFGYLGRFVEEKGLSYLLHAFHHVSQTHPNVMLWLIGDGPMKPKLAQQASRLGLSAPRFQILPCLPHHQAPEALSAMDTLILPSVTRTFWKEQFGRVLIEALACGTPVIGSDSGEIPHLIRRLNGGLVVPEADPDALAEAMIQLLTQPDRRKTLAQVGCEQVLAGYTNVQLARGFYDVLQTLQ